MEQVAKRVSVKYAVLLDNYTTQYKTKIIRTKLPVNNLGFILFDTLGNVCFDYLKIHVVPSVKGAKSFKILSYQIVDPC